MHQGHWSIRTTSCHVHAPCDRKPFADSQHLHARRASSQRQALDMQAAAQGVRQPGVNSESEQLSADTNHYVGADTIEHRCLSSSRASNV